jgi:hypothetical protein
VHHHRPLCCTTLKGTDHAHRFDHRRRWATHAGGPDPLDYVLRYAAGDYDCYHRGRYIGSRPTLQGAIEAIKYEQEKAARHPQPSAIENSTIAAYQDELCTIAARLQDLAGRLATHPTENVLMSTQLTLARIRISEALLLAQDAERSFTLAQRTFDLITPLDSAA